MPNPKVTAIMPTYQRPEYVTHAVALFQQQRYNNKELLILDDSPKAMNVKAFGPNVRYVWYSERASMAQKHNDALKMAQGDLLMHWDDDDWSSPLRMTRQVEPTLLWDFDVVGLKVNFVLVNGEFMVFKYSNVQRAFAPRRVIGPVGNSLGGRLLGYHDGSALFKRTIIKDADYGDHPVSQKVVFLNRLVDNGAKTSVLENDGLFVYVRHDRNTWQFGDALRLVPVKAPFFFPKEEQEFYRKCVS